MSLQERHAGSLLFAAAAAAAAIGGNACRCDDQPIVLPIADGVLIAPYANPEDYVERLERLGAPRLLVPWTDVGTNIGALRGAARGRDIELIIGLIPVRRFEEEWNTPEEPASGLGAALDRALGAGDALRGVHLDQPEPGLPDEHFAAYLDQTLAAIRARTGVPISFAIRARTITPDQLQAGGFPRPPDRTSIKALDSREAAIAWADAWAAVLASRVDRIVVHTENAARNDLGTITADLDILRGLLGARTELWATVEPLSPLSLDAAAGPPRLRPPRPREEIQAEVSVLRGHVDRVLIASGEAFAPDELLGPAQRTRDPPAEELELNLEHRANEMNARMRRCCLRDGQIATVYDQRFERDHGENMWQEDACWLTGLYTSAMSFRFAVTHDPEAEAQAREAWRALHQMANTTPMKGEVVRNYTRTLYGTQTRPVRPGSDALKRWRRRGDRELYWVGDISVDQLSGWFNGVTVYHDLVANADERREIAFDVSAVLDMFLDNDLRAIEFTGQPTTFGDLRAQPILALAFFQIGFHITGDARYRAELERLLDEEGMHFQIGNVLAVYHAAHQFGSDHFYSSGFYPLLSYEADRGRRSDLELSLGIFHALERRLGNAYGDMVYGVFHPGMDAWRRAALEVIAYRPELSSNAAWLAEFPSPLPGPFVPIESRPAAELDFDYVPPGAQQPRGGIEHHFSGVGFLIAYWMGRYHGLMSIAE